MMGIVVIVLAVVLPKSSSPPPTSSPETVAINTLWRNVGDQINKNGASWNTDPDSTQYQALDWLANVDHWSTSFKDGDIPTQVLVERYALVVLWMSTVGEYRPYTLNVSTSVCTWAAGIICDENDEFVTQLKLTNVDRKYIVVLSWKRLRVNVLPYSTAFCWCVFVHARFLADVKIKGTIPSEVALLTSLVSFIMANNTLSETLPTELGLLTNLNTLDVERNRLSGYIPTELGQLTGLTRLDLFGNDLVGPIPTEIGLLTNMQIFGVGSNSLTGSIPTVIGTFAHEMSLERNRFTGTLPTELGLWTTLTKLNMYNNLMSGTIPTEIGLLTNIIIFDVGKTGMSGTIPTELGQCTALVRVSFQLNEMSGTIPTELGKCTALIDVLLHGNYLSGNLSDILCDSGTVFEAFWSDCGTSNVTCSCCTACCDGNQTCTEQVQNAGT